MPCENYKNYIEAYCDDVLPFEAAQKVETHIGGCASCGQAVRDYQSLNILLNSYAEDRVPEERFAVMRSAILDRISQEDRNFALASRTVTGFETLITTLTSRFWQKAAIAVTCVVLVLVGLHVWQRPETVGPGSLDTQDLAVDPHTITKPVVDEPAAEPAGNSTTEEPMTEVASQILQELNLMQIEMNSSVEFEQLDLYESIFDEWTNNEVPSDDG